MIANHAEMGLLKSCNDVSAEFKAHGVTIWFLPPVWRKLHHEANTAATAIGERDHLRMKQLMLISEEIKPVALAVFELCLYEDISK